MEVQDIDFRGQPHLVIEALKPATLSGRSFFCIRTQT